MASAVDLRAVAPAGRNLNSPSNKNGEWSWFHSPFFLAAEPGPWKVTVASFEQVLVPASQSLYV